MVWMSAMIASFFEFNSSLNPIPSDCVPNAFTSVSSPAVALDMRCKTCTKRNDATSCWCAHRHPPPSHRRTWLASSGPPSCSDAIFWSLFVRGCCIPRVTGLVWRGRVHSVSMLRHGWSSCHHPAGAQRTGCAREQAFSGRRWRVRSVLAEEVLQGLLPRGCPGTR